MAGDASLPKPEEILQMSPGELRKLRAEMLDAKPMAMAEMCKAHGTGLETAITRQTAAFTIDACDHNGNSMKKGGELFRVDVRGSSVVRARVVDNKDGSYSCTYVPSTSGSYSIAITLGGDALPGSPFTLCVLAPRPYSENCQLRGEALSNAVAREQTAFEVSFIDALGAHTHAEELDVYCELLDADDDGKDGLERIRDAARAAAAAATPAAAAIAAAAGGDSVQPTESAVPQQIMVSGDTDSGTVTAAKTIRRLVRGPKPLIVRSAFSLDSEVVGSILVGKLVDVVEARETPDGLRARVILCEVQPDPTPADGAYSPTGGSPLIGSPRVDSARLSARPFTDPFHVCNSLTEASSPTTRTIDNLTKESFRPRSPPVMGALGSSGGSRSGSPAASRSGSPPETQATTARGAGSALTHGWVTAVQSSGTVLLANPYVRLDAGERQQHMSLWQRRRLTDNMTKAQLSQNSNKFDSNTKAEMTVGPSFASELESDHAQGVAFAFGGCDPGTLHARGQVIKNHTVRYSIGLAGRYRLHVGLRQQGVALPGSPFLVTVQPSNAHAPSTQMPEDALPLVGPVGGVSNQKGNSSVQFGCVFVLSTKDKMGNLCNKGGAKVNVAAKGQQSDYLKIKVTDLQDGSYQAEVLSETSGIFQINVQIDSVHIVGSPTTLTMTAGPPDISETILEGEGLRQAKAGLPAEITVTCMDVFGNRAQRNDSITFGLALVPLSRDKDLKENKEQAKEKARDANYAAASLPSMKFNSSWLDEEHLEIHYLAEEAGDFDLHVWCDELRPEGKTVRKFLNGSPFAVRVSGVSASPQGSSLLGLEKYCTTEGGNLAQASMARGKGSDEATAGASEPLPKLPAGEKVVLKPQLRDEFKNASLAPDGLLKAFIDEPASSSSIALGVRQLAGLGLYEVSYEAIKKGTHSLHVTLSDEEICGSPFTFVVLPGAATGNKSRLKQKTVPALVNVPCEMELEAVDKFGNRLDTGGATIAARALGTSVSSCTTVDNEDGTYTCTFTSSVVGDCRVIVRLDNMEMSPVNVIFEDKKGGKATAAEEIAGDAGEEEAAGEEDGDFDVAVEE